MGTRLKLRWTCAGTKLKHSHPIVAVHMQDTNTPTLFLSGVPSYDPMSLFSRLKKVSISSKSQQRITVGNGLLPYDILSLIFSHFTFFDLVSIRLVSKLWSQSTPLSWHLSNARHSDALLSRPYHIITDPQVPTLSVRASVTFEPESPGDNARFSCHFLNFTTLRIMDWNGRRQNPILLNFHEGLEQLASQPQAIRRRKLLSRKSAPPWHAMYFCLPPVSRVYVDVHFASRSAPSTDDARDDWFVFDEHCGGQVVVRIYTPLLCVRD